MWPPLSLGQGAVICPRCAGKGNQGAKVNRLQIYVTLTTLVMMA